MRLFFLLATLVACGAQAALEDIVVKGSTDRSVTVKIIDAGDGTPETAVVFNTSGIDLWYRREGAAQANITEATLAALTTAHADGGFLHVDDGVYRLDLPDAAFATGAQYVDFGGTVTGMIVIGGRVRLVDSNVETANMPANMVQVSGDPTAADNIETAFDDTCGSVRWMGIVRQCLATAGAATTITLDASASTTDDAYNDMILCQNGNAGTLWECELITDYVGSTKVATVAKSWLINPTAASNFIVRQSDQQFLACDAVTGRCEVNVMEIEDDDATDQIGAATSAALEDTLEMLTHGVTLYEGVVTTVTSQTLLIVTPDPGVDRSHQNRLICIEDLSDGNRDCTWVNNFTSSSNTYDLSAALRFTIAVGDLVRIYPIERSF